MKRVFLGKISGPHGRPNSEGQKFKVLLFSFNSSYMQDLKVIGLSQDLESEVTEINLTQAPQSSGAKWGHSKEILLSLPSNKDYKNMPFLSIRREQLPEMKAGEYLLSDFLGIEVENSEGKNVGKILGCQDHMSEALHQNLHEGINLVIGKNIQNSFSLPLAWVDEAALKNALISGKLRVENIEAWMELDSSEKSDEGSEGS